MAYRAPCLSTLMTEVNARWPNRSRVSDGWIGDASHSARTSDHNPSPPVTGVVRAQDITNAGIDLNVLLNALIGDHRVNYIISRGAWCGRDTGWAWRPYYGTNAHNQHVHVSIRHGAQYENDTRSWGITASTVSNPGGGTGTVPTGPDVTAPTPPKETTMTTPLEVWAYKGPGTGEDAWTYLAAARASAEAAHRTAAQALEQTQAIRADILRADPVTRAQLTDIVTKLDRDDVDEEALAGLISGSVAQQVATAVLAGLPPDRDGDVAEFEAAAGRAIRDALNNARITLPPNGA
jgi:hypothetical protein